MAKIRVGKEFGIDLEQVIAWTYIVGNTAEQDLTNSSHILGYPVATLIIEERILLYTSAEILVIPKAKVGLECFTKIYNCLLSMFDDIDAVESRG
jgi:hypothetical protein